MAPLRTKDTKTAQPATENEFIAIISLAATTPTPQFHFFGLGGWPKIMTAEFFSLKTSVCVCVCVRPPIISFLHTHTEGPVTKQTLCRSEVIGMIYIFADHHQVVLQSGAPVEKDTMENIYHCLCSRWTS